jgi:hypothetical protein
VQLLVNVEALEDRQRLDVVVVVLDAVGELRRDRFDVPLHVVEERAVVDDDRAVLLGELLTDDAGDERGLPVEQPTGLRLLGQRRDLGPLRAQPAHVALELFFGGAFGGRAHDEPGVVGTQVVENAPQTLALVVGEPLRDPVGLGLPRNHDDETTGEAHLLREPRALVPDRVLGDLHDDRLTIA